MSDFNHQERKINMDGKIEMTLDEYASLIRENERLKETLVRCRKQLKTSIRENLKTCQIGQMTKEECVQAASQECRKLIGEFAFGRCVERVFDEWPCFSKEEIEEEFGSCIREKIKERMEELPEDEQ